MSFCRFILVTDLVCLDTGCLLCALELFGFHAKCVGFVSLSFHKLLLSIDT